jgi:cytochrome c-type protein NapB
MSTPAGSRYWSIATATALMAAAVFVIGQAAGTGEQEARTPAAAIIDKRLPILTESGVFERSSKGAALKDVKPGPGQSERHLVTYYSRRSYPGGPPPIPHTLLDQQTMGGKSCLVCHLDGGWVSEFKAFTPVTPHPQLTNCRSCHVHPEDKTTFQPSTFTPAQPVALPKGAMPGAPPPIPHELEMRSNCLACHGGPAAPAEIRTTHPERANCRQCHVLNARPLPAFSREGAQ